MIEYDNMHTSAASRAADTHGRNKDKAMEKYKSFADEGNVEMARHSRFDGESVKVRLLTMM
jgi:hypothetical protein